MKYAAFEELKTEQLLLRKLREADAECYFECLGGREAVTRFMLWQPHKSLQESRDSIGKVLVRYGEKNGYCWAITRKNEDTVIGRIDLLRFDEEHSSCSFAYMLAEDFWNQGFGTEALQAVFTFAFENMQMQSITADHFRENPASGKVMQKVGMCYLKTEPSKYEKNGIFHDADVYTITYADWKQANNK